MCSMHGLPTIGTIGFGWFDVRGLRRVPSPPAMTTAFIRVAPRSTVYAYCAPAASASASPVQKNQSGHSVPSCVTITNARDAYRTQVASLPRKLTFNS